MTGPKRTTDKQIAANRANALASTGPRTPAGIERSRWNALTHGALSKAVIPPALEPFESRAAFEELFDILRSELAPATAMNEPIFHPFAKLPFRRPPCAECALAGVVPARSARRCWEGPRPPRRRQPGSWRCVADRPGCAGLRPLSLPQHRADVCRRYRVGTSNLFTLTRTGDKMIHREVMKC